MRIHSEGLLRPVKIRDCGDISSDRPPGQPSLALRSVGGGLAAPDLQGPACHLLDEEEEELLLRNRSAVAVLFALAELVEFLLLRRVRRGRGLWSRLVDHREDSASFIAFCRMRWPTRVFDGFARPLAPAPAPAPAPGPAAGPASFALGPPVVVFTFCRFGVRAMAYRSS